MAMLGMDDAMRDSMQVLAVMADAIFESYALKMIRENIDAPVGCFYLVQSVGVVAPEKLLPLFERVPFEHRNKLYEAQKQRVKMEKENAVMADMYLSDMSGSLAATAVGKKFQNFELADVNGGTVLLSDEVFANRYTLVLFWGSWRGDAKEQLAMLSSAYDKYRSNGLQVVAVSLDESVEACKAFVDDLQIAWPQLCNPAGGSAEVAAAYGVTELPAAVLINNKGTIIARMTTVDDVLSKFDELF
jgi:peroxiredoxin